MVLRLALGGAAVACLSRAVRAAVPRSRGAGRCSGARRALLPPLLDQLARLLAGAPALRRPGDDAAAARRRALAPQAWPWRLVGADAATDAAAAAARLAALRACTAVTGLAVAGLAVLLGGAVAVPAAAAAVLLGVTGVDLVTAAAARDAERRLIAGLPDLLESLAACFEAGLVLEQALHLAGRIAEPPLDAILRRVLAAARLGEPAGAALRSEAERCGVQSLLSAATTIERGRRLGEPVAPALLAAASSGRADASSRAAIRSARTASLAALVVAMVIAPACVIAVLAVVIGGVLGAGHPVGGG